MMSSDRIAASVRALSERGFSIRAIARVIGLSERRVKQLRKLAADQLDGAMVAQNG
ncbi:helix-turn-helix domain-containing protein [Acetobacter estunensis]|uniref:helix-turn-helix domain-containing protein n=1 Tax=Acetobacter estunensis TaxID=104097 RepID=UPI001C2D3CFB|nr:hypothetical protein [Acetobacter estunensis]MBV1835635.1 hypothetical protein [Acetobacter estunensis]MBV1836104.1 hypothetical protein [Acetobacter estunensis]